MDWLTFLIAALAVYRVARMMALEDGPFEMFAELRGMVFAKFGNGWVNDGFNCPLCLSFWFGLIVGLLVGWSGMGVAGLGGHEAAPLQVVLYGLALSGAAAFLYKMERK